MDKICKKKVKNRPKIVVPPHFIIFMAVDEGLYRICTDTWEIQLWMVSAAIKIRRQKTAMSVTVCRCGYKNKRGLAPLSLCVWIDILAIRLMFATSLAANIENKY